MQYVVFIQCFSFSGIFYPSFHIIMHDINDIINSEFRTVGIFAISFRYRSKDVLYFYNVSLQCEAFFVSKTLLLHVQNVVKWTLIKIKKLLFSSWKKRRYTAVPLSKLYS